MSDPAAAFAAAIGCAARALQEARQLWADHPRAIAPLAAATDGPRSGGCGGGRLGRLG